MAKGKNYKVLWSHAASRDLELIVEFISRDNVTAALQILNKLRKKAATLKTLPLRGRVVPELAEVGLYLYREIISPPLRIVYRFSESDVYVMMVVDGRRNSEDLLLERLTR